MELYEIRDVKDVMQWLDQENIAYSSLGDTAFGDPLLVMEKQGEGAPVLITAGAHAGEPSGVFAALTLLKEWRYTNPLIMVPLRDPFGFQGYEACLSHALGQGVTFQTHDQLWALLLEHADQVLHQDESGLLVEIGGVLFTNLRPPSGKGDYVGPRSVELWVNKTLKERPELVKKTAGKRIVFPSNAGPDAENVWDFYRAFSAEITGGGVVADMNRRFGGDDEPNEVKYLRQLCDKIKAPVVLDLHEGQGSSYYFFVPDYYGNAAIARYTDVMHETLKNQGEQVTTLDDVCARLGEHIRDSFYEPLPGVLVDRGLSAAQKGSGFSTYAGRYGAAITVETGRWAPIRKRVGLHLLAARALLDEMNGGD